MRQIDHDFLIARASRILAEYKDQKFEPRARKWFGITIKDYTPNITKIPLGLSILRSPVGWSLSYRKSINRSQITRKPVTWSINLLKIDDKWSLTKTTSPDEPYWDLMLKQASSSTFDDCDDSDPILTREQAAEMLKQQLYVDTFEYNATEDYKNDRIPLVPATETVDIDGKPFMKRFR